jgi:hypothetical protein
MQRFVALLIMLVPGVLAVIGIKLMRDIFFGILHPMFLTLWLQFIVGLLLVGIGITFVGGFILHRDQKRNKVQNRFRRK